MKKYRLKADIPGHKAGEIFERGDSGVMYDAEGSVAYTASEVRSHPDIMDWFEEVSERWEPEPGETYYAIDGAGNVCKMVNAIQYATNDALTIGNCFRTEEEAEQRRKWLKAEAVLRADTADQRPSWGDPTHLMYQVFYDYEDEKLGIAGISYCRKCPFAFDNRDDAERSIAEHKAEWLTFLGVE